MPAPLYYWKVIQDEVKTIFLNLNPIAAAWPPSLCKLACTLNIEVAVFEQRTTSQIHKLNILVTSDMLQKSIIMIALKIVNSRFYLIEIEDSNLTWPNREGWW